MSAAIEHSYSHVYICPLLPSDHQLVSTSPETVIDLILTQHSMRVDSTRFQQHKTCSSMSQMRAHHEWWLRWNDD